MEKYNHKNLSKTDEEFDLIDFNDISNKRKKYLNLINLFSDSKFNVCFLHNKDPENENKKISNSNNDKFRCIFRYVFKYSNFYFLSYDMNLNSYLGIQNEKEMIGLNFNLNPSLEFNDINNLIEFLQNKLFSSSKDFNVHKDLKNKYYVESLIDIIKVNWEISTIQIDDSVLYCL